ncbi:Methenyltetrahydrofolate cyclohydrolase [Psidium guajava]|nr:Methenyltetrahydrofolate cyclohydrolase [Psidium guajava]
MKPQHPSGDGSPGHESKRPPIRERLRRAYEAAVVAAEPSRAEASKRGRSTIPRDVERRKSGYHVEDPIRTMMFLGPWNHT